MPEHRLPEPLEVAGRKFSSKQLIQIQDTVAICSRLSRWEIALTVCEHLNWTSPKGQPKTHSCLNALERFERLGLLTLPEKQLHKKMRKKSYSSYVQDLQHVSVSCGLEDVAPLELQLVTTGAQRDLWNGYIEKYHYLGYQQPFASHLRYFIVSRKLQGQFLGCILFAPAAKSLKGRDDWIGWSRKDRVKGTNLIVCNSRFLIFPWIKIESLASRALSMSARRITDDWHNAFGYRPVLLETFVDPTHFEGTCYKASNWHHIGNTSGRGRSENQVNRTAKKIFVYPLREDFRSILRNQTKKRCATESIRTTEFTGTWRKISDIIAKVAHDYDKTWQKRYRVIDTLMLVLLVFRLVLSRNSQGYATAIMEFWDNCYKANLTLPQRQAVSSAAFCEARNKLDEEVFKTLNTEIIRAYENETNFGWRGHRLFAVDGTGITLPRNLINQGFRTFNDSHYPTGHVSTLYQLKSRIPYDFILAKRAGERAAALSHLDRLKAGDVVVYDRGYFSFHMLHEHTRLGINGIFRLKGGKTFREITQFIASEETDKTVTIRPHYALVQAHPDLDFSPLQLRLIKYTRGGTEFYLGTTLMDASYSIDDFADLYHARWGVEELYKVSKCHIDIEDFHARKERGVRQELYAHFVLITLSRLLSNKCDDDLRSTTKKAATGGVKKPRPFGSYVKSNFKNCLSAFSRFMEVLIYNPGHKLQDCISRTLTNVARVRQVARSNRSYERRTLKPDKRWQGRSARKTSPRSKPLTTPMPYAALMENSGVSI